MAKINPKPNVTIFIILQDRTSPIQGYGTSGALDWTGGSQPSSAGRHSHYYPSTLSTHPTPGGYSPYTSWDSTSQAAYSPYNMPSSHCKFFYYFKYIKCNGIRRNLKVRNQKWLLMTGFTVQISLNSSEFSERAESVKLGIHSPTEDETILKQNNKCSYNLAFCLSTSYMKIF